MTPRLTQQQAIDLIKGSVGKLIDTDALGVKDDYGGQCIALISYYLTSLGYPSVMKMNAIDFYNLCTTTNPLKLQKVSSPQPGDILYINMSFEGKHFSHVSVVIENGGANIVSADANWVNADLNHGSPVAIVVHPASSITAFFRPTFKQEEPILMFDEGKRIDLNMALFREDKGFFKAYLNQPFEQAIYNVYKDYDFQNWMYANGGDVYNYLTFFAGHAPTADDYASLGANPNGPGTQPHKQVIYKLTQRPDVQARLGSSPGPTTVLQPGHYEVKAP